MVGYYSLKSDNQTCSRCSNGYRFSNIGNGNCVKELYRCKDYKSDQSCENCTEGYKTGNGDIKICDNC